MIIKRELGEKGQVVIPKDIRDFLNLKLRGNVVFEIRNNEVLLKSVEDPERIVNDFCNIPGKKKNISIEKIKEVILERYNEIP